jgi:hypothetical protein
MISSGGEIVLAYVAAESEAVGVFQPAGSENEQVVARHVDNTYSNLQIQLRRYHTMLRSLELFHENSSNYDRCRYP